MTTTTADTKLTRAEAAYAHLASFTKDDRVVVSDGRSWRKAVVRQAARQATGSNLLTDVYLIAVTSDGYWLIVSVSALLDGQSNVEHGEAER